MKIIYDLAKNGLAKLNLPLELNFFMYCTMSNNYGLVIFHVSCPWKCCGCWHWSVGIFHVLFVQKKSDLLLALKMLWWWFARNRQQARGTLPPCLHCQTATGKQPPRVGSPPGYRREWRIKKIPGGGFLALGMLPSAAKVGLIEEFPAGNRVSGPRCHP